VFRVTTQRSGRTISRIEFSDKTEAVDWFRFQWREICAGDPHWETRLDQVRSSGARPKRLRHYRGKSETER